MNNRETVYRQVASKMQHKSFAESYWTFFKTVIGTALSNLLSFKYYFHCLVSKALLFFSLALTVSCFSFWLGERREGSAPLVSDLLVTYEAQQGLIPIQSSYTDTHRSVVMLTINFKVFGVSPGNWARDHQYHRQTLYHCTTKAIFFL